MSGPQWVVAIFLAVEVVGGCVQEGELSAKGQSGGMTFVWVAIKLGVYGGLAYALYLGGFWS